MEVERDEQYAALKFCFRLGKNATEAYEMLKQAYGEEALPRSTSFRWFKDFSEGRQSTSKSTGILTPVRVLTEELINTAAVIVREDRRITVDDLASILNISHGSAHTILHDHLHMRRVCARWVPRLLTPEQKQVRVDVCRELQQQVIAQGDGFLKSVVTGDESWVHHFDPESKQASSIWKSPSSPTPKKAKTVPSAGKVMVITFFDCQGMLYLHTVPRGTSVNGLYYVSVLRKLMDKIRRKRPNLHATGWKLHHDNARPHVANVVTQFLAKNNISCVPHPPYSPDLAPCDFFLFPELKAKLRGVHFTTTEEVVQASQAVLKCMSKDGFQHVFDAWQKRWKKCIEFSGEYFEKDHSQKVST